MKAKPTSPGCTCAGVAPWLLPLATNLPFSRAVALRSTCEIAAPVLLRYAIGRTAPIPGFFRGPWATMETCPGSPAGKVGLALPARYPPTLNGCTDGAAVGLGVGVMTVADEPPLGLLAVDELSELLPHAVVVRAIRAAPAADTARRLMGVTVAPVPPCTCCIGFCRKRATQVRTPLTST